MEVRGAEEEVTGRLRRVRVLYRSFSRRRVLWLLVKDTVDACMEYRVTGLAAEAAFFTLISVPPLLLGLVGALGYLDTVIGTDTIDDIRRNILAASSTVLTTDGVDQLVRPLLDSIFGGGRPDVISIGFMIALWSGSRTLSVFVDTITIMYGLEGRRGIVATRLLAFALYLAALLVGAVVLPLMLAGPDLVVQLVPRSEGLVGVLYWPVVLVLSVVFLTTLYHMSVPVRTPWVEDLPGALVALVMWVLGSFGLRLYLTNTVEGPTIYGSLAAPVAVLLWIFVSAFAVLVGAALNAAVDRTWPSLATAAAREEILREREEAAAEEVRLIAERRAARARQEGGDGTGAAPPVVPGLPELPELPDRWSALLRPSGVRSRFRRRRPGGAGSTVTGGAWKKGWHRRGRGH
ncbi:YihY/virulence factor BrkB family protein [Streptomyces sp. NPDC059506]|uniref:YihY/virulence factor BrkB family protein n=1 Tax=Streptomyces TaxID=1883 RepID=UPI0015FB4C43|nr:YihY/virulence factor BrkB family protein [Streptomyces sp. SCUT-3]QMV21330.1 YihY/virulence factor BrkB family protein [Streptomyces sp. SCUT-3]